MTPAHLRALAMAHNPRDPECMASCCQIARGLLAALDVIDAARTQADAMDSGNGGLWVYATRDTERAVRAYDALAMDNEMERRA